MEKVYTGENGESVGIAITSETEVDVLLLSIDMLRADYLETPDPSPDPIKALEGSIVAGSIRQELEAGKRILTSEEELYLSKISLRFFRAVFNGSIIHKKAHEISESHGLTTEQYIDYMIAGMALLNSIESIEREQEETIT